MRGQDKKASPRGKPEDDLAACFPPVKIALGEKVPDIGADTALAVEALECADNLADVTALHVPDCLEYIEMDRGWFEHFSRCKGYRFHGGFFHG